MAATGKQQELTSNAFESIQIGFGLWTVALHCKPQAQPRDWAFEIVGDASKHRGSFFFAALKPRQHGVEAPTQALDFSGPLLRNWGRTLFQSHPGQGPLQSSQGTLHLKQ